MYKYGISLNPKKFLCGHKSKWLGHIIHKKKSVIVDTKHVKVICQLLFPRNNKEMQYFFENINFVRRFKLHFVETNKPL